MLLKTTKKIHKAITDFEVVVAGPQVEFAESVRKPFLVDFECLL